MTASNDTTNPSGTSSPQDSNPSDYLHSIVAKHPDALEFQQRTSNVQTSRSVLTIKPEHLPYSLLGATLAGPETIIEPYVFTDDDAGSILVFYHLGCKLAGHAGIVHGGISAVLLDECMGRACFPRLPGKIAVTATLDLQYKSPIPVNSVIMVQAVTKKIEGRKAFVEATIQDANDGRDLVKATALYIQPKWAAEMSQII